MAHEIDLKNYKTRTDILIEELDTKELIPGIDHSIIKESKNLKIEEVHISKTGESAINKKEGFYTTISFKDVTDKDNFKEVESALITTLKKYYSYLNIDEDKSVLVIGLGNELSTPDALGPLTINNILVTKYLFELGEVEEGYRSVSSFKPSVTGITGIETRDLIEGIVEAVNPDFLIIMTD